MEILRQVSAVLFVFALLGAILWTVRRGGLRLSATKVVAKWGKTDIRLLERVTLTPQHSLHCIQTDGREFLVVTHPQGCTILHTAERALSREP